ncbi:MAG: NTP transferase domain-containing protein [Candidatus Omnitrophica bacterium]|nr:NTP transferase domain-containing protein [Candidatus Omnitrophota bacterium]
MKAIILAGGKGKRLAPFTVTVPKPLLPLGDKSILEIIIGQLNEAEITDIKLAVGYSAELIEAYFGNGRKFGVPISYLREDSPLGTAGPIWKMRKEKEDFIVMNGDVLASVDFGDLMRSHKRSKAVATICAYLKRTKSSLGVIESDEKGFLMDYHEKPELSHKVSTGIYCLNPKAARYIKKGERVDLPELMLRLVAAGEKVKVYDLKGRWFDIGTPSDYRDAVEYWEKRNKRKKRKK